MNGLQGELLNWMTILSLIQVVILPNIIESQMKNSNKLHRKWSIILHKVRLVR